jgi:integrase
MGGKNRRIERPPSIPSVRKRATRAIPISYALRIAKVRPRTPCDTRHTFNTWSIMNGSHVEWIAKQVGHKNPKMIYGVFRLDRAGRQSGR